MVWQHQAHLCSTHVDTSSAFCFMYDLVQSVQACKDASIRMKMELYPQKSFNKSSYTWVGKERRTIRMEQK